METIRNKALKEYKNQYMQANYYILLFGFYRNLKGGDSKKLADYNWNSFMVHREAALCIKSILSLKDIKLVNKKIDLQCELKAQAQYNEFLKKGGV